MNKRGVVLIFGLLVAMVLIILVLTFWDKTMDENNFVIRYVNSVRALWVAEAGVAEAIVNLPNSPTNGNLGSYSYATTTVHRITIGGYDYYDIVSTGIVDLPSGGNITREVNVVVKEHSIDPTKFRYSIQAANDLCFGGQNCNKDPYDFIEPDNPPGCFGGDCYTEFDGAINFADMFGYGQAFVSSVANHYTETTFPGAISGVTWVDVTPGQYLTINGGSGDPDNPDGTGILIVNGDLRVEGSYVFRGIIYVLGTLRARGTFDSYGSIVTASSAGIDSINGTPDFFWDQNDIANALQQLSSFSRVIVSWKETS